MPNRPHPVVRPLAAALVGVFLWSSAIAQNAAEQGVAESRVGEERAEETLSADAQAAVDRAESLGHRLYLHDRAAWLATDAMFSHPRMRKLKDDLDGWVTDASTSGIRVVFYSRDASPRRLFEIEVDERERLSEPTLESPEPLGEGLLAQIRARKLAIDQDFMTCARQYNSVVLPESDRIRVYMLPAFSQKGVYPLGGYHLFETDGSGEKILSARAFSKSCIEHRDSPEGLPKGAKPAFSMFTHLLDPQPTEIHAFVSRYSEVPMMIMTIESKRTWTVAAGEIALSDTRE